MIVWQRDVLTAFVVVVAVVGGGYGGSLAALVGARSRCGGETSIYERSRCDTCGSLIPIWLNVPVLSWAYLRGRCRSCHSAIGIRVVLPELACGLGWGGVVATWGVGAETLPALVAMTWLVMAICANDTTKPSRSIGAALWYAVGLTGVACVALARTNPLLAMAPWGAMAGGMAGGVAILLVRRVRPFAAWLIPGAVAAGMLGATSGVGGCEIMLVWVVAGLACAGSIPTRVVLSAWLAVGMLVQIWPFGFKSGWGGVGLIGCAAGVVVAMPIVAIANDRLNAGRGSACPV